MPFFAEVDLAEASFVATSQLQFAPELLAFAPSSDPEAMVVSLISGALSLF